MTDAGMFEGIFGDEELAPLFSDATAVAAMVRFERALAKVEARDDIIPAEAGPAIDAALDAVEIAPGILHEGTAVAGVPVPALVAHLRKVVGMPHGQYVHWGATSQDVMDTGLVLRLREALDVLERRLHVLIAVLAQQARRHADVLMAARTRSQVATPTTFGLRIASWAAPLIRCCDRLNELRPRVLRVQLGGAAGALSVLGTRGPEVVDALAVELGLHAPPRPWHAERDGMAELAGWLAGLSGLLARIGADLILLGRSEIAEVKAEPGGGSSTMPQKQNPVLAEALVTLGREASAEAGLMLQVLVHTEERDATAWAAEWRAMPRLVIGAGAGLRHAETLVRGAIPDVARMAATLETGGGAVHAEALAFALTRHMPLTEAQAIVKAAASEGGSLIDSLAQICAGRGVPTPEPDHRALIDNARMLIERTFAKADAGR